MDNKTECEKISYKDIISKNYNDKLAFGLMEEAISLHKINVDGMEEGVIHFVTKADMRVVLMKLLADLV